MGAWIILSTLYEKNIQNSQQIHPKNQKRNQWHDREPGRMNREERGAMALQKRY